MQWNAIPDAAPCLALIYSDTPTLPELISALSERGIDLSEANVRMGSYGHCVIHIFLPIF